MCNEFVVKCQWIVAYICLAALALIFVGSFCYKMAQLWDREIKARWKQLDGVSKFVVSICLIAAVMYGGSKPIYNNPPQVGADDEIKFWFIDINYDTNTCHSTIMVVWTNDFSAASINTPLSYRQSSSNDWTTLNYPLDARVYQIGYSNILEFTVTASTNDYTKFSHWWFGTDCPATEVIVVSDDLQISTFDHTSEYVDITIVVSQALQEIINRIGDDSYFMIQFSDDNGKTWIDVAETKAFYTRIPGFWYGKDRIWRVIYIYQAGDASGGN